MSVVKFAKPTDRYKDEMVEYLEEIIGYVKKGDVTGMSIVLVHDNLTTANSWRGLANNVMLAIAELRVLETDLINAYVELRDYD